MARSADDVFRRAVEALQAGRAVDAERAFRRVLDVSPRHPGALNLLTVLLMRLARWAEAERFARRAARETPNSDVTLYNLGLILRELKRPEEALEQLGRALALNPRVTETRTVRAGVLRGLGRLDEALADLDAALAVDPACVDAHLGRGAVLGQLGRHEEALAACDRAASLKPDLAEAWVARGQILRLQKRQEEALAAFARALSLRPDLPDALQGQGATLAALGRFAEALAAYDQVLARSPDLAEAWVGLGDVFFLQARHERAVVAYDRALALDAALARAWLHRAKALFAIADLENANRALERAAALEPTGEVWLLRASIASASKDYSAAVAAFEKAMELDPGLKFIPGARLHNKLQLCDWSNFDAEAVQLLAAVREGQPVAQPLNVLALSASAADQLRCAEVYGSDLGRSASASWCPAARQHDRIRIGYLSADLRDHPAAYLTAGLFERHDRSRFEIIAVVWGDRGNSALARRIDAAVDRVIDISEKTDAEAADVIRALEIDILVDLMGFTQNCRFQVLTRRPAPIQVNFLGFPGTLGSECIDYLVADHVVIPDDQRRYYAEHVVRLPHSFQANDDRRAIAERSPSRAECGLPNDGFVFCCFNNSYKILPELFDIWMRLLARVDGSVLWLLGDHPGVESNLRKEATGRGIDAGRLIFADRVPYADYLARYQLADLFLDTFPFNAGTTASDALWVGLPVLTCPGEAFASRMAASLLQAAGLPELVTRSMTDYEAVALALAADPARLDALRTRLRENRRSVPLFDTARYARHLEAAFLEMWRRLQAHESPADFAVSR